MEAALELKNIRKTFGTTVAVEGMDLVVPRGALYGVIGPNGAGKTTCIRMIMSILFPDSGGLSVLGQRSALEAKDRIGYLPEERGVYRKMKVGAFLAYMAQLKGLTAETAAGRVPRLLQDIGLPGVEQKRCEDLSKGMLQRVQFLAAIIHQPDLLILDEPFSGQDPVSVRILREHILREHRRGATVLLSTHVMAHAEEMCQHVVMIHEGRKVLDEAMAGLRRQFDPRTIHFEPLEANAPPSLLETVPGVERVEAHDGVYRITLLPGIDPALAMARLASAVAPARIELARRRLEDVFVGIVAGGARGEDAAGQVAGQPDGRRIGRSTRMKPSVRRIGLVAGREFMAAVTNRGFVLGLLLMPALFALMAAVVPRVISQQVQAVRGEVAVVDRTGQVAAALRQVLSPEAISARRLEGAKRALENTPAVVRDAAGNATVMQRTIGTPPTLTILERPAASDLQREKQWLMEPPSPDGLRHLALIVIQPDAIVPADGRIEYGGYELFVPENLDERIETELYDGLRESLVAARMEARNLDRPQVEAITRVRRATSVTVAAGTERRTNMAFNRMLPFVFAGLLVFGVLIGGQTLLTQTVEEKSNRVVEVLLSAVSPIELMAGKILGQMGVSMLVLALYVGMGLFMLMSFAMIGLLDPVLILYLVVFFVISYLLFAAVFSAVGAAVNEMREAQSLMTPVMLALMAPWMFAPVIGREPNSMFAIALSFIPPVNTFAMMIRLASNTPPPAWQVLVTIVVGLAAACGVTWFAAKIFKVGLLMHGKAPNMATLMRWAREA